MHRRGGGRRGAHVVPGVRVAGHACMLAHAAGAPCPGHTLRQADRRQRRPFAAECRAEARGPSAAAAAAKTLARAASLEQRHCGGVAVGEAAGAGAVACNQTAAALAAGACARGPGAHPPTALESFPPGSTQAL
eukprot:scaffold126735_cov20-Tisochrysis_lutea.AAC.2